jgi:hypothetical protein
MRDQIKPDYTNSTPADLDAPDSGKAIFLTSRTHLEEAKQFEDDHDNYDYPDDVEDASVHDGDWSRMHGEGQL